MMSRIEQLISEIEEYIDSCKFQALSNSKIIVNKEELEELLVELRLRIPDEIKKYQKIISQQETILNEAQAQADAMLDDAKKQADSMVAQASEQTSEMINEHESCSAHMPMQRSGGAGQHTGPGHCGLCCERCQWNPPEFHSVYRRHAPQSPDHHQPYHGRRKGAF